MATQLTPANETTALALSPEAEKFTLMQRQAALFASSPLIPQHLRNGTPQQAMANCYIAMTIADRMGEDRMTVMQNIHIVHGVAGFKTEYKIARANASGVFKDGIDWEVKGSGANLSATAYATLASTGRRVSITVDMAMAKAEGWTKNSKYQTMPEIMLRYRSASFLIRMYAPQVMLGYQSADEIEDVAFAAAPASAPLTGQALLEQAREDPHGTATGSSPSAEAETPDDAAAPSSIDPETPPEASAHETKGELFTDDAGDLLAEAKARVDRARSADRVLEIQDEYREKLSPDDQLALSTHAMATVSAKWPEA